jgi:hypothetical protein
MCDNHDTKSVVITCCGHSFGTECFKRWRNTCFVNHRDTVSCPTCRKSDPIQRVLCYTRVRRVKNVKIIKL